jgi:hypothetical protein
MYARVVAVCVATFAFTFTVHAAEPRETKLKPTVIFTGTHSAIQHETFDLIATESGWKELWKKHRGEEFNPLFTETFQELEIDFETHYVVVIFTGRGSGEGCEITARQRGDVVFVGFKPWFYQTEGRPPITAEDPLPRTPDFRAIHDEAKSAAKAPYAFVVLPKPVKTIVIERNVQSELGRPPVWNLRFLFPVSQGQK